MFILGLDTSSPTSSIALLNDDKLIFEYIFTAPMKLSAKLIPAIKWALEHNDVSLKELNGISVTQGPGSFTGLRIGLTAAKTLGQTLDIPTVGEPTLDVLAFNLRFIKDKLICPIIQSRRGEIYSAIYRTKEGQLEKITDYLVLSLQELLKQIETEALFTGADAILYQEPILKALGSKASFHFDNFPRASTVARMGLMKIKSGKAQDFLSLKPLYLKRSQAEIKLKIEVD